jgi:hypothetical protein
MPWIVSLLSLLVTNTVVRAFVVRIAIALGISVATYAGISTLFATMMGSVSTNLTGVPSEILQMLQLGKVTNSINVIASAYVAAFSIRGLAGAGVLSKISLGKAGSVINP